MFRASPVVATSDCNNIEVLTASAEAPPNAVKAECLSVRVGRLQLLAETELTIPEPEPSCTGRRYGLVGPNGSGKSTLMRLLAEGHLPLPRTWSTMLLDQHLPAFGDVDAVTEVLSAHPTYSELTKRQAALMVECERAAEDEDAMAAVVSELQEVEDGLQAFEPEERVIEGVLAQLGFNAPGAPSTTYNLQGLSGGWQMKVQLAKAFWIKPKLLLLDEPTNHLDTKSLLLLEDMLRSYPHSVMLVSHDVQFLSDACTEILWLHQLKLQSLPRELVSEDDLARMLRRKPLNFKFTAAEEPHNHGISFHGVSFDYEPLQKGKKPLLRVAEGVRFRGGSRAVVLGKNGSGKSTFLGLCAGTLEPLLGDVDRTDGCVVSHFSQANTECDTDETAVQLLLRMRRSELADKAGLGLGVGALAERRLREHARAALSQFGLEGDVATAVPCNRLSGGQRVLLKFTLLSLRPAHLLIFDEPTNHLDCEARAALVRAFDAFDGGVIVVSHDETLSYRLLQVSSRGELVVCQDGRVTNEKDFSGYRLSSLREQVRRAQEAEELQKQLVASQPKPVKVQRTVAKPRTLPVVATVVSKEETALVEPPPPPPPPAEEEPQAAVPQNQLSAVDKKIKALRKKLREIDALKARPAGQHDAQALEKLAREGEILAELARLEDPESHLDEQAKENAEALEDSLNVTMEVEVIQPEVDAVPEETEAIIIRASCADAMSGKQEDCAESVPSCWMDLADAETASVASSSSADPEGDLKDSAELVPDCWMELDDAHEQEWDLPAPEAQYVCWEEPARQRWSELYGDSGSEVEEGALENSESESELEREEGEESPWELPAPTADFVPWPQQEVSAVAISRHSRARKDVQNLCKAAAKWQRQHTVEELHEKILTSRVALECREKHGTDFDPSAFLSRVLTSISSA